MTEQAKKERVRKQNRPRKEESNKVIHKVYKGTRESTLLLTIPAKLRKKLDLQNGDNVLITIEEGFAVLEKVEF